MNRFCCHGLLVVTLIALSSCLKQDKEPPKPAEADNLQAQNQDPPGVREIEIAPAPNPDPPKPPAPFINRVGIKFVWIPPGTFMMGSPPREIQSQKNETLHKVTLTKGFYMGACPVTQEQWQEVMGHNPSHLKGEKNLPVDRVTWNDCQNFIARLRAIDGNRYRLPSEAEWEYACRAGTTTPFHFGETISAEQANYNAYFTYGDGKQGLNRKKSTPVGSFPANGFGLYDMHGNVWQWCQDWYGDYPPGDAIDPQGPEKGQLRVKRGGSWLDLPVRCRSAFRSNFGPHLPYGIVGVRVCIGMD